MAQKRLGNTGLEYSTWPQNANGHGEVSNWFSFYYILVLPLTLCVTFLLLILHLCVSYIG
jgi:hypothetical protein